MAYQKGRQQYVAIALETPRLTANVTPASFRYINWNEFSIGNKNEYKEQVYSTFTRGKTVQRLLTTQHVEGNMKTDFDADVIPYFLYYTLGAGTPTTALGATTWAFSVIQALESPTFTINYKAGDENNKKANGALPTKLSIDISTDNSSLQLDFSALQETTGTVLTPVSSGLSRPLQGHDTVVKFASTKAGLTAGTTIKDVKSCKITIETGNDISRNKVLGSRTPVNNVVDGFEISIELDLLSEVSQASTIQSWHDLNTKVALSVDLNDILAPVIGTSALKPRCYFEFPPSSVEVERTISLDDLIMQKLKIKVESADLTTVLVQSLTAVI
jgi:hypothetical protein